MKINLKPVLMILVPLLLFTAAGYIFMTLVVINDDPLNETDDLGSLLSDTQSKASSDVIGDCGLTKSVTEGPYYVSGTSLLQDNNLNYDMLEGTPIVISGYVYAGETDTEPIPNAKIELWQTDSNGSYHPNANGAASKFYQDEISLRGYVVSDVNGAYSFSSIYPGYYEGRPRHIHVKISADGYKPVFTQLLFQPQPEDGVNADDTTTQSPGSCYVLDLDTSSVPESALFTFRLEEL